MPPDFYQDPRTLIGHLPEGITSAIPVKEQGGGQEKIIMRKVGQGFSSCIVALLSQFGVMTSTHLMTRYPQISTFVYTQCEAKRSDNKAKSQIFLIYVPTSYFQFLCKNRNLCLLSYRSMFFNIF